MWQGELSTVWMRMVKWYVLYSMGKNWSKERFDLPFYPTNTNHWIQLWQWVLEDIELLSPFSLRWTWAYVRIQTVSCGTGYGCYGSYCDDDQLNFTLNSIFQNQRALLLIKIYHLLFVTRLWGKIGIDLSPIVTVIYTSGLEPLYQPSGCYNII